MAVKTVSATQIKAAVISGIGEIFCRPTSETAELLLRALDGEPDEIARDMLAAILQNHQLAARERLPLCQDTGLLIVFAEIGTELLITGGTLEELIGEAAGEAWRKYYLRDSLAAYPGRNSVSDSEARLSGAEPLGTSLPFILHLNQVPGDKLTLHLALKGGGAENCSALRMFLPGATLAEIEDFVVQTVVSAGGKPCPPVFVGVGIGGDFEACAILAKRALMQNEPKDPELELMEARILKRINELGRGVMGFAGSTTALKVSILTRPRHIASLPVAVNLDCHAHRSSTRVI
ncbi:MAG TPA: fumarate hydratase [Candidatus Syntrophosphaera sp.]|nr:fumarate hydratase [Candidatus Syntrophosphaera sp.]HPH60270.1 fumarate hydratase [Candidatus Syntrophosphaera sp.]